jgi:predicted alpha/beta superfamily hydrolase
MSTLLFRSRAKASFVLACLSWTAISSAQPLGIRSERLEIGVSHTIQSKVLSDHRIVNVVLPSSYSSAQSRRYPVLYVIDGGVEQDLVHVAGVARLGAMWGRSAEAIVVGIETKDRRRELVGRTTDPELLKRYPTAGSSAKFREFIRTEVKPLIEGSYRTNQRDAVIGESLAGLFIVETYVAEPKLFGSYGAVDPSLWWDKEALSKAAAQKVGPSRGDRPILLAVAKEQLEEPAAFQRLVASWRASKPNPCLVARPDQTHATIYQQVTPMVLQYLLPPEKPAPAEYGFNVTCSQSS